MKVLLRNIMRDSMPDILKPISETAKSLHRHYAKCDDTLRPSVLVDNLVLETALKNSLLLSVLRQAHASEQYPVLRRLTSKMVFATLSKTNPTSYDTTPVESNYFFDAYKGSLDTLALYEVDAQSPEYTALANVDALCSTLENNPDVQWLADDPASSIIIYQYRASRMVLWGGTIIDVPHEVQERRAVADFIEKNYYHIVLSSICGVDRLVMQTDKNYELLRELVVAKVCQTISLINTDHLISHDKCYDVVVSLPKGQAALPLLTYLSQYPTAMQGIITVNDDIRGEDHDKLPYTNAQELLDDLGDPEARARLGEDICKALEQGSVNYSFGIAVSFDRTLNNYLKLSGMRYSYVVTNPHNYDSLKRLRSVLLRKD